MKISIFLIKKDSDSFGSVHMCFKVIHHKGSLRGHDYLPYQEAKVGLHKR
jgi:hypothetical protein